MEEELIQRCRRGETQAWDELFHRHYEPMARFVFQLSPDFTREDVEEICQESFFSVIKNLSSFKGQSQLQTWIFRIAANKARDYRQKLHAAKRGGGVATVSLQAEDPQTGLRIDPAASALTPDAHLLNHEKNLWVDQGLQALEEPCREVIHLRYFGDLSYEEIGKLLGLNVKTVSSRLSKCLDRLETVLRDLSAQDKPTGFPSNGAAV